MHRRRRLEAFRKVLSNLHLDGFLLTRRASLRYFTGFSGSHGIGYLSSTDAVFLSDFRYRDQVRQEVRVFQCITAGADLLETLRSLKRIRPGWKVGFESEGVTVAEFERLKALFPDVEWVPQEKVVEHFCMVKEEWEIGRIAEAARLADEVFLRVLDAIRPGAKEQEVAAEILAFCRRLGAERCAFEPIVASGPRSALPHGAATDRELKPGDPVVIDFGCVLDGYCSDLTRTVVVGRADGRLREIYGVVRKAQAMAREAVRPGIPASRLDAVARRFIEGAGYGPYFRHALGHGLGLEVHHEPKIGPRNPRPLPENAVITIEPGIYLPGLVGVRIEDDVVVRQNGAETLTRSTRDLLEIR